MMKAGGYLAFMKMVEIILYVRDQSKSKEFYSRLLKAEPVLDVPGMTEFVLNSQCKLGLMPEVGIAKILREKTPDPASGNGIPRAELYLQVEDPGFFYETGVELGAIPVSAPSERDWGDFVGYIADPDGHILAFAKRLG